MVGIIRAQYVMGTILELEVYGKDAEVFIDTVFEVARSMDESLRRFWKGWVSKGETLRVDKLTDSLLVLSIYYIKLTDTLFNPFYRGRKIPSRLERFVWFFPEGCSFDPGGITKGFALDIFVSMSKRYNLDRFIINFGGSSIYGRGVWSIKIPDGSILTFRDVFVSFSSPIRDGKFHIFNPKTQEPVKGRHWSMVITVSGVEGDVLSTVETIKSNMFNH